MSIQSNKDVILLHVINNLSMGGAELLLNNTLKLLPDHPHIVVYLFPKADIEHNFRLPNIELICLHHKGWTSLFSSVRKLKKIIKKRKPVLVHSHLFQATICARLAVPVSVPLVSTLHSLYSKDLFGESFKSLMLARMTVRRRHHLIAVSGCVMEDYLKYVPFKGKRFILHNFLPDSFFQKRNGSLPGDIVRLVAVGNLKEAKNYYYLLEIFKHLREERISLDIYGKGPLQKELATHIQQENLNVRLCGITNDVSTTFSQYDVFIQASSHEGFGLSVIEAMANGIPVILSDIPVFRETTNNLATFFPLNDAARAAAIIKSTLENGDLCSLSDKAFGYAKSNYSAGLYRRRLMDIYQEVIGGRIPI